MRDTKPAATPSHDGDPGPRVQGTRPQPETGPPSAGELEQMLLDSIAEGTDGCIVEPDGTCERSHQSWLLYLELI